MTDDLEYLLLKEEGRHSEVLVRKRLSESTTTRHAGTCRFYVTSCLVVGSSVALLLLSLLYAFTLLPSLGGKVLTWDGRPEAEARSHVLTDTQCGPVEGLVEEDVYVFKGIPYAVPPVGSRRWREPEKMSRARGTCWKGTMQAKAFGSICVQPTDTSTNSSSTNSSSVVAGNEDCLFLNVWTLTLDPLANRPVIVWIHGGHFVTGSGHAPPASPTLEVTKSTRAVYVSMNYRLGAFGFVALDVLGEDSSSGTSGNYGLMDTFTALEWVKDNIRNFGGNPNKVTVMGQGSGAALIQALLTSPHTAAKTPGLFHGAWISSPSSPAAVLDVAGISEATSRSLAFLRRTGCQHAACLRGLSMQDVMRHSGLLVVVVVRNRGGLEGDVDDDESLGVVIDGHMIKESPLHAWKHGRGLNVPIVFSTMALEASVFPVDSSHSSHWTWEQFRSAVSKMLTSPPSSSSSPASSSSSNFFSSSSSSSPSVSKQVLGVLELSPTKLPSSNSSLNFASSNSSYSSSSSSSNSSSSSSSSPSNSSYPATSSEHVLTREALELYGQEPGLSPESQYAAMLTDIAMTCPVDVMARAAAMATEGSGAARYPVYRAVVKATPSGGSVNASGTTMARPVGWDVLAFFGNFASVGFQPGSEDLRFVKVMREQVMSFARRGQPEAPVWDSVRMCTALLLSDHVFPVEHYGRERCDFWARNGFVVL